MGLYDWFLTHPFGSGPRTLVVIYTGLTGGGQFNLDGEPTIGSPTDGTVCRFYISNGTTASLWQLIDSTHIDDPANGWKRPIDYKEINNEKVWRLLGFSTSGGGGLTLPNVTPFQLTVSVVSPEACSWSHVFDATVTNFPNWQCGTEDLNAPLWTRSFSPEWNAYWGTPPNGDTGDWYEDDSNDVEGGLWAIVSPCHPVDCSDPEQSIISCWLRWGTVNGQTGWHALLFAAYTYDSGNTSINTEYSDVFIGDTLNGTFNKTLDGWTWTWTFVMGGGLEVSRPHEAKVGLKNSKRQWR